MDAEIVRRIKKKDPQAYKQLIEYMEKPLMNFIHNLVQNRSVAEDIFQETFVRVVKSIHRFSLKTSLSAWIFKIARNLCIDHLRKVKRQSAYAREVSIYTPTEDDEGNILYFSDILPDTRGLLEKEIEKEEERRKIRMALSKLPPQKREIIILRIFLDMPYSEISKILSVPAGTLKYRFHEALCEISRLIVVEKRNVSEGLS